MSVYLLHYDTPLGGRGRASARHYIGHVNGGPDELHRRVEEHLTGRADCRITEAFFIRGSRGRLVRVWPNGDKGQERRLKRAGHYSDHCPLCRTSPHRGGLRHSKGSHVWL